MTLAPQKTVANDQAFRVLEEKVAILVGERGNGRKAAMREGDAQDLREFIAKLRKGTADVQKGLAEAVDTMTQLSSNLDAVSNNLDETKNDLAQTEDALEAAQGQLSTLQDTLASVQSSIDSAQAAIDALGASGATVAEILNNLKTAAGAVTVPDMSSDTISAAPTQTDYNLLFDDVVALRTALISLRSAVST